MHQGLSERVIFKTGWAGSVPRIPHCRTVRKFSSEDASPAKKSLIVCLSKLFSHRRPCETLFLEESGEAIAFLFREIAASPLHVHLGINQNRLSPRSGKTCVSDQPRLL